MIAFGLIIAFLLVYFLIYVRQIKRKRENSLNSVEQFHNNYLKRFEGNQGSQRNQSFPGSLEENNYLKQVQESSFQPNHRYRTPGFNLHQKTQIHYTRNSQPRRDAYNKYITKYNSHEDYREK